MKKQPPISTDESAHTFDLHKLQKWMQSVISHVDGIEAGIESEQAQQEIDICSEDVEQVIKRSENLTSIERLGIYGNAYYARLMECLRESFPALEFALGRELFDDFSFGYLQRYPSESYSLGQLGNHFAQYLRETRPDAEQCQAGEVDWPDFLIDLATLEWNIEQVFDGPGAEGLSLLEVEQLGTIPDNQRSNVLLKPVPSLRIFAFQFPVNDYFTEFRKEKQPQIPPPREQFIALTRRHYVVRRLELEPLEYKLLRQILRGDTIGESIESAAATSNNDLPQLADSLHAWFQKWTEAEFFCSADLQ